MSEYVQTDENGYIKCSMWFNGANDDAFAVWTDRIDGLQGYAIVSNGHWAHMNGDCPFDIPEIGAE